MRIAKNFQHKNIPPRSIALNARESRRINYHDYYIYLLLRSLLKMDLALANVSLIRFDLHVTLKLRNASVDASQ